MLPAPRGVQAQFVVPQEHHEIRFTENRGQILDVENRSCSELRFVAAAPGMSIYLAAGRISYVLQRMDVRDSPSSTASEDRLLRLHRVDLHLIGAQSSSSMIGEEKTSDFTSYYYPHCPDGITGVPSFHHLSYRDIWPKIDMEMRGAGSGLKYDLIVQPGGDVESIRLKYSGAEKVELTDDGSMLVSTSLGTIRENPPLVYQRSADRIDTIPSAWRLEGDIVSFAVGRYDSTRPLVIDPELEWSTYYGGQTLTTTAHATATDAQANVVMVGATWSSRFPVSTGAFQKTWAGFEDAYIVKFDGLGIRRWATYYGGEGDDRFHAVATDQDDAIVASGMTASMDFPVSSPAFQSYKRGSLDACLVRFDSNGARSWGTYLGAERNDFATGVAVAPDRTITVCGATQSTSFTVRGDAFQTQSAGEHDCFISSFTPEGSWLWSTYYGGAADDVAQAVATDRRGNILVAGQTFSRDFPVLDSARQPTMVGASTAFALKLDRTGGRHWATFIGGTVESSSNTGATGIATDSNANVIIGGWTNDASFTSTIGSFQKSINGLTDGFLIKMDSLGRRDWATYIGGIQRDSCLAVAVDRHSSIHISGSTTSPNFPVTQGSYQFGSPLMGFAASFDSSGRKTWSTFHGGSAFNRAADIAVDSAGALFLTGTTESDNFPVTPGAFQGTLPSTKSAFITKFGCSIPEGVRGNDLREICRGESIPLTAYQGAFYRWSTNETTQTIVVSEPGVYHYLWIDSLGCAARSGEFTVIVHEMPQPVITGGGLLCRGDSLILSAGQGFTAYRWSTGETSSEIVVRSSGIYWVEVFNEQGCEGISEPVTVAMMERPQPSIAATKDSIGCTGDSTLLTATGDFTRVEWSTGERAPAITVRQAGIYSARVWNADGCDATAYMAVRGYQWEPAIRALGPLTFCDDDSVILASNADYAGHLWSTGETTPTITVGTAGSYWLEATDANGCIARSENITVNVLPSPPTPVITMQATGLRSPQAFRYQWSRDGIDIPGATSQNLAPDQAGSYRVKVFDANGCSATSAAYDHDIAPWAALAVGNYMATPGTIVSVELALTSSRHLRRHGISRFTARLRYRSSLLAPVDRSLPSQADGRDRLLTIAGDLPPLAPDSSGVLARIDFIALLGDTTATALRLQEISWDGAMQIALDTSHGEFRIDGLCIAGSSRLVAAGGEPMLRPARPDPASGLFELEYEVNEDGMTELLLVDAAGRTTTIIDGLIAAGRYLVTVDAASFASGIYTCILRTPTMALRRTLRIIH